MAGNELFGEVNPYEPPRAQDVIAPAMSAGTTAIDLSTQNPFLTIWTKPRATIRAIVDRDPRRHVIILAMLSGIVRTIDRASQQNAGDKVSLAAILGMAVALGPVGGLLGVYVGGWFVRTAGRWLDGYASPEQIRAAIAWSFVPVAATIPIWILQLGVLGRELFTRETPTLEANPSLAIVLTVSGVVEAILGLWSFVILLKCVGEVQRFSAWRALASFLLLFLAIVMVVIIPIALIAFASR
jgi:hypothetical protein